MRKTTSIGMVAVAVLVTANLFAGEIWPDYRGPSHDGHSDAKGLPLQWSDSKNVVWKTAIHGRGWSSPVVADGKVWLTTATPDGKKLSGLCVDAKTGKVSWDKDLFLVSNPQFAHKFNSYASPSPLIDGDKVYLSWGSPGTACVDRKTKKIVWERSDLVCDHFRGAGSSPLIFENLLILTMDGADVQYLIALDKTNGKTVWRKDRSTDFRDLDPNGKPKRDGDMRKSYATPILIEVAGKPQLLSPGAKSAFAYEPRTGKEIWTVRYENHSSASRTVYGNGLAFINTGYSKAELLAVKPTGKGDVTKSHVAWRMIKGVPNKPSPLLVGEHLYLVTDGGVASCVAAKTGKVVWQERVGGEYSSAPVCVENRIYAFSQSGKTVVFRASPEKFELLAENKLGVGFMASPAIAGKAFYLRSKTHLYRIESK